MIVTREGPSDMDVVCRRRSIISVSRDGFEDTVVSESTSDT